MKSEKCDHGRVIVGNMREGIPRKTTTGHFAANCVHGYNADAPVKFEEGDTGGGRCRVRFISACRHPAHPWGP